MLKYFIPLSFLFSCTPSSEKGRSDLPVKKAPDTLAIISSTPTGAAFEVKVVPNDSLEAMAHLVAGTWRPGMLFEKAAGSPAYKTFSENFSKRWSHYDSTRVRTLREFSEKELITRFKNDSTLFYPFSGPDILYPSIFFPKARRVVMVGLEPVGTLPNVEKMSTDSLGTYYSQLNEALYAILRFSFFRTESMRSDLRKGELDGVIHLLLLFLNRTGNRIVSACPVTTDSLGQKKYLADFETMQREKLKTKGVEIKYLGAEGELKELSYFSVNAADFELKNNPGFINFLSREPVVDVYLKGASYLLHKPHFSIMRNFVLAKASSIVQDDSGLAIKYLLKDSIKWSFSLYGEYTKPIAKFAKQYQPSLDSLYKSLGSKQLAFGLGYNYRDKNSNFMIATKTRRGN